MTEERQSPPTWAEVEHLMPGSGSKQERGPFPPPKGTTAGRGSTEFADGTWRPGDITPVRKPHDFPKERN